MSEMLGIVRSAHAIVNEHVGSDRDLAPALLADLVMYIQTGDRRAIRDLCARIDAHDGRAAALTRPFLALEGAVRAADLAGAREALCDMQAIVRAGFAPPAKPPAPTLALIHPRRRGGAKDARLAPAWRATKRLTPKVRYRDA